MSEVTFIDAINQALTEEMERDPNVLLFGEDVGVFGGAFKATRGLLEKFGAERVYDMPISESGFTGMACGAAIEGFPSVVEYQFADFIACAFDQIVNFAAKLHYRWGIPVPVVLRAPTGGYVRGGPYHSVSPEAWFLHVPGLKVLYPSTPYDAKGLLKSAIRDPNPVLFFEHKALYRRVKEALPEDDHTIPLGQADVKRTGRDLSIVTWGYPVHQALEVADHLSERHDADCEVVDLRSLCPLDMDTILESVSKTWRTLVVHEANLTAGFGAEIAARIADEAFDVLDAPVARVAAADVPIPFAPNLEDAVLPSVSDIERAALRLLEY